jgi:hypothetical protein
MKSRRRVNSTLGVSSAMKLLFLFLIATVASVSSNVAQEKPDVPEGWTKSDICHISFYAPPDIKQTNVRGIDSCVAQFVNSDITLYLDYGIYGGLDSPHGSELEWKHVPLSVDGKNGQLTTYVDASHSNSGLKYVAGLYVVVKPGEPSRERDSRPTTLMMSVISDRRTDRDAALAIFRTLRFD